MRRSISGHRKCLKQEQDGLLTLQSEIERLEDRYTSYNRRVFFYALQIREAAKKKLKEFDDLTYLNNYRIK